MKRRRPGSSLVACTVVFLARTQPSEGFHPIVAPARPKEPFAPRHETLRLHFADTTFEDAEIISASTSPRVEEQRHPVKEGVASPPPWLRRYEVFTREDAELEVRWLEYALLEHGFSFEDTSLVIGRIRSLAADESDPSLLAGLSHFLKLFLRLLTEEDPSMQGLLSVDVLLASLMHYADCIMARREGLQDYIQDFLSPESVGLNLRSAATVPFTDQTGEELVTVENGNGVNIEVLNDSKIFPERNANDVKPSSSQAAAAPKEEKEAVRIARGAARIKRAEILAKTVLEQGIRKDDDASRLRGMLMSVMDDWRSLAIRCIACLYRLEGILLQQQQMDTGFSEYLERTPEVVGTAREAMRVYATLAQRLGMHRLKSRIEGLAFRILYRRQYRAVSSLYRESGTAMKTVSAYLSTEVSSMLQNDSALAEQLEDLKVTARVKEPYSLWRKLLSKKFKQTSSENSMGLPPRDGSSLSVMDVQDSVALRVILRARKWTADESEETTQARERLLCYYVQQIIRTRWPELNSDRVKDYIMHPKPNGYQSLHHTSSITSWGLELPFEIQVRSESMHNVAEFGLASHWDYKLGDANSSAEPATTPGQSFCDSAVARLLPPAETSVTSTAPGRSTTLVHEEDQAISPYIDALVTAKKHLSNKTVYVFLAGDSQGQILNLPTRSSVRDAIMALDDEMEDLGEPSVFLNGRESHLDEYVKNGDVLSVTM